MSIEGVRASTSLNVNSLVTDHHRPVDPEEYVEAVLALVEQIPSGRVTTYGAIADRWVSVVPAGSAG